MSTTNKRTLGQSQNTHVAVTSAMRFAVAYRKRKQLPTEVKEAEIVGDNIVDYMSAFCCWAAVTSIPKYFDENLHQQGTIIIIMYRVAQQTLSLVISGSIIGQYVRRFPNIPSGLI